MSLGLDASSGPLAWAATTVALVSAAVFISQGRSQTPNQPGGRTTPILPPPVAPPDPSTGLLRTYQTLSANGHNGHALSINDVLVTPPEIVVTKILVHPIKSCRGISVSEWAYTPAGLEYDRKWCIVDANTHAIITAREIPKMVLIEPQFVYDPTSPHRGSLVVSVPSGEDDSVQFSVPIDPTPSILIDWPSLEECTMFGTYKMDAYVCGAQSPTEPSPSQVLSDYLDRDVYLVMKGPTRRACPPTAAFPELRANTQFQDGYPLLVASEESLDAVEMAVHRAASCGPTEGGKIGGIDRGRWYDGELEIERFRPNIVLRGAGKPFSEDKWREISIDTGSSKGMRITLVSRCARCMLPNVDPRTGVRDTAVPYKVLMKFRTGVAPESMNSPCFGCNGVSEGRGTFHVGDLVRVLEYAKEN
jgi:uncharacterized protein